MPEHEVLSDRERGRQPEVLVHHADAGRDRVPRGAEGDRLTVDQDLALVRSVEPGQDVGKGRLAGPILAE